MNECEHVIVVDVCCTIKRPTTMCLAKKEKKKKDQSDSDGIVFCGICSASPCQTDEDVRAAEAIEARCNAATLHRHGHDARGGGDDDRL